MENKLALLEDKEYGTMGQALAPSSCADALPLPLRCRRGQLIVPAIFVIPSLFLFIILVFEITKLSREKIRHQFAVDSASFIEMTNYSDFLNRSAYINGAFPERIFAESFYGTCFARKDSTKGKEGLREGCEGESGDNLFHVLYKNNLFASRTGSRVESRLPARLDAESIWPLRFPSEQKNADGTEPGCESESDCLEIMTKDDALAYWVNWEDAVDVYKLYFQIYQLLGSVYDAQYQVWKRLTGDHSFFHKSYWLNSGDDFKNSNSRNAVLGSFERAGTRFKPEAHCVGHLMFWGNTLNTRTAYQPYKITKSDPIPMNTDTQAPGCGGRLFQFAFMNKGGLADFGARKGRGFGIPTVYHRWKAPSNYWNLQGEFDQMPQEGCENIQGPCVRATVGLTAADSDAKGLGRLWPDPTPKFQVRLYP